LLDELDTVHFGSAKEYRVAFDLSIFSWYGLSVERNMFTLAICPHILSFMLEIRAYEISSMLDRFKCLIVDETCPCGAVRVLDSYP
jgi:hypothetical protein